MLIDADYAELATQIPWWENRTLRFRFRPDDHPRPRNLNSGSARESRLMFGELQPFRPHQHERLVR
jgi:hypothetical protein